MPRFKLDGVKALSVNKVWQGRRFKTKDYKDYEKMMFALLPPMQMPPAPYTLKLEIGFSNDASDVDNANKPFQDILAKHYHFNDKNIYRVVLDKYLVAKGQEYIIFEIKTLVRADIPPQLFTE